MNSNLHGETRQFDVKVFCGKREIFKGKWQSDFHSRLIAFAYQKNCPVSVLKARDNGLLFQVNPSSIWEGN